MPIYRQLLPSEGLYCVAKQLDDRYQHFFHTTIEEVQQRIELLNANGHTVFLAQASFLTPDSRKKSNVSCIRSLWIDVDCGPTKPYLDQAEGARAISLFAKALGIHCPTVVSSGNGLYAHLPLDLDLKPSTWESLAHLFKQCCVTSGLKIDPARSCDCASVLRPVGATHRKDPTNPKPVTLIHASAQYKVLELIPKLKQYLEVNGVKLAKPKHDAVVNSEFAIYDPNIKMNADAVARKCSQVAFIKDNPSQVSEPMWYAAIGMLRYAENGEAICHEWSSGYIGYSREETDKKIQQHINANIPPTTCEGFNRLNPGLCESCKHCGKITTPLQLGRQITKTFTPEQPDEAIPKAPPGFAVTDSGVVRSSDEGDALLCADPIYPVRFGYDVSTGYETTTFRHKRPFNGWQEITLRSSLLCDPKSFCMALLDKSVLVSSAERKSFVSYVELFSQQLRKQKEVTQLASQQGWCESDTKFLLGDTLYEMNGKFSKVGVGDNVPPVVKDIREIGDWQEWVNATRMLSNPSMRGHAFALLAGTFGAPLMTFSGYSGAMVSLVGDSGVGKSLIGNWSVSAYGDPSKLTLLRDDTKNSLMARMGLYNNLPAYIDEISNIPGEELSELVYRVTQGREKNRLNKNAVERANVNEWRTLTLASSNHSLVEKLANIKGNASAEINRVFEYDLISSVERQAATRCYNTFTANYGGVGRMYVQHLVNTVDKHKENIAKVVKMIDDKTKAQNEERFWSSVAGVSIYGGLIASKLGLIEFSVEPLIEWVVETIKSMRVTKNECVSDIVTLISGIIDKLNGNIIVMDSYDQKKDKLTYRTPIKEPRGALLGRIELSENKLWMNREAVCRELYAKNLSPVRVEKSLRDMGVVIGRKSINLGRGTCYAAGSVSTIEFDLNHKSMGFCRMRLVDTLKEKRDEEDSSVVSR